MIKHTYAPESDYLGEGGATGALLGLGLAAAGSYAGKYAKRKLKERAARKQEAARRSSVYRKEFG